VTQGIQTEPCSVSKGAAIRRTKASSVARSAFASAVVDFPVQESDSGDQRSEQRGVWPVETRGEPPAEAGLDAIADDLTDGVVVGGRDEGREVRSCRDWRSP